jgi:hypothetical protein
MELLMALMKFDLKHEGENPVVKKTIIRPQKNTPQRFPLAPNLRSLGCPLPPCRARARRVVMRAAFSGLCAALLVMSCASLVDKAGGVLDGSVFEQKVLARYATAQTRPRGKTKEGITVTLTRDTSYVSRIIIEDARFPHFALRGIFDEAGGVFELTEYTFLCSNPHGWNNITEGITGTGAWTRHDAPPGASLTLNGAAFGFGESAIERIGISDGAIRRGAARLSGEEALTALRNRRERLLALAQWMREQHDVPAFKSQQEFAAFWKPVFFPELSHFKKAAPPFDALYAASRQNRTARRVFGDDVLWNAAYTELLFTGSAERLRPVRDSGALLRDWEESLAWLYLEYSWDSLVETLTRGVPLVRQK